MKMVEHLFAIQIREKIALCNSIFELFLGFIFDSV